MPNLRRISHSAKDKGADADLPYGVAAIHNYVGDMSSELAKMARAEGDEKLALLLEMAADMARSRSVVAA